MNDPSNTPDTDLCLPIQPWRWIFLASEAALVSLMAASMHGWGWQFKARTIDEFYHPLRSSIVILVLCFTISFQFFIGPIFFRRLGMLAVVAWLTALAAFVWINLPVF